MARTLLNSLSIPADTVVTTDILDANVTTGKIADNAVTLAKMASGTDGNVISYDASGNPVAIATGSAGQLLTSAGAGAPPTFAAAPAGGLTVGDQWRLTTDFTGDADPIASNWERVDTASFGQLGSGMTESSGIFTFPSTGIYLVTFNWVGKCTTTASYAYGKIYVTPDNSSYVEASSANSGFMGDATYYQTSTNQCIIDVTNTTNIKVTFKVDVVDTATTTIGSSTVTNTGATFLKLGAT